jgi:hypothetical protein
MPERRAALLEMAEAWIELEREAEKKSLLKPSEARNDPS